MHLYQWLQIMIVGIPDHENVDVQQVVKVLIR